MKTDEIDAVPNVTHEARAIFVNWPTADDPTNKVTLQAASDALAGAVLDLQSEVRELRAQLAAASTCLESIGKALHGEVAAAKSILAGITPAKGVN